MEVNDVRAKSSIPIGLNPGPGTDRPPALAQGPNPPQGSYPTWQAFYWNNKTLSGAPVLVRNESDINYDWATFPCPSINADNFSRALERATLTCAWNIPLYSHQRRRIRVWETMP